MVLMGITFGLFIIIILVVLSVCLTSRKKFRKVNGMLPQSRMFLVSDEIKDIIVDQVSSNNSQQNGAFVSLNDSEKESKKVLNQTKNGDNNSAQSGSFNHFEKEGAGSQSGEDSGARAGTMSAYRNSLSSASPMCGLPEFSHLGWGHWFTLKIGEGGYRVVYRGQLINGSPVSVKKLLNNLGQAEKEFRVEVEAIGHVRHKNLVRLLGLH